ncbi:MAG TPA: RNA polymerase sigma factor [Candidatus Gracilibacteria bacterium]|nr:RNA polymerase sigma factor [Candidatus Gracilibacteria bacterium]
MSILDHTQINGLVEKSQAGDSSAFAELYDLLIDEIYRFIYYKTNQKELAEDLCAETFIKVWQNLDKYQNQGQNFSAWVYRIAHNITMDYFRQNKTILEELDEVDILSAEDPRQETENFFNQQILQKAIQNLPDMQKEAIILKYINDLSNVEIAKVLDKSETAVRVLLSRGITKLKEKNLNI